MKNNTIEFAKKTTNNFFHKMASFFSNGKKNIIILLSLLVIVCLVFVLYKNWVKKTIAIPAFGGKYIEGIVINNEQEKTDLIDKLTKISLTKFDKEGNIVPNIAESWEVIDDTRTYIFKIKKEFNRDEIALAIKKQKDKWANVVIENLDDDKIICRFSESFAPFLSLTTYPIVPDGLYKLVKSENNIFYFKANKEYFEGSPNIEELIIKVFSDEYSLMEAYKRNKIDGIYKVSNEETYKNMEKYSLMLPRYNMAFINNDREIFKTKEARLKIRNFEKFDNETNIIIVALDTEEYKKITENLVKKWEQNNIKATIYYKNSKEIINNIIPKRDYDILIYGLDYSSDPDPYPFWHSSQIKTDGFNLANFSNIDADILLEDARKINDNNTRKEKYQKFWEIFNEEAPAIIISQEEWFFGVNKKVKGIETGYSIAPEDRFFNIKDWYIKTKRVKVK